MTIDTEATPADEPAPDNVDPKTGEVKDTAQEDDMFSPNFKGDK